MAIQPETIAGRKEYFRKQRSAFAATWTTDESGIVHIPLGNGFEALISACKKDIASQFLWRIKAHTGSVNKQKYYAVAPVPEEFRDKFGRTTSLHRVVFGADRGVDLDHRDGDSLNCVDSNLRIATKSQNSSNRLFENSTGYRGVFRTTSKRNPFGAQISVKGKTRPIGRYPTSIRAAKAYNAEATRLFGEFAILNTTEETLCQS